MGRRQGAVEPAQARGVLRGGGTVFADPLARVFDDPGHSVDEHRFLLLGVSYARRELIVVHVERGDRLRIISARSATGRERAKLKEGS